MDFHYLNYMKSNLAYLLHNLYQQEKLNYGPLVWLVYFDYATTIQEVLKEFINASLKFDDDFIVALKQDSKVSLWELYRIAPMLPIQSINVGNWTNSEGLYFTNVSKWTRRSNLNGYKFKITSLVEDPYTTKIEFDSMSGKYNLEGSYPDLLNLQAKTLNFTYTYVPPPDNAWGSLQEDGTWNGMVALIQNGVVDFCEYLSH